MDIQAYNDIRSGALRLFLSITQIAVDDIKTFKRNPATGSKKDYEDSMWFFKHEYDKWLDILELDDQKKYADLRDDALSGPILVQRKPRKPYVYRGPEKTFTCPTCNKSFKSRASNAKYCPQCVDEVKKANSRRASAIFRANNPDYHKKWTQSNKEGRVA